MRQREAYGDFNPWRLHDFWCQVAIVALMSCMDRAGHKKVLEALLPHDADGGTWRALCRVVELWGQRWGVW